MNRIVALVLCSLLVTACGMSNQPMQYASWDNMYYYDPYGGNE